MKCPRCQQENRPGAKFCLECGSPLEGAAPLPSSDARLRAENEELRRALTESREQQRSTAEILRVISRSTELQTVLNVVAESAARVCGATDAHIYRLDGDLLRFAASYGPIGGTALARERGVPASRETVMGRSVVDRRSVHVHDLAAVLDEFPRSRPFQERIGFRSTLATPLLREGVPLGAILIRRMEVRPFSEDQIKLLETFADQAAIAIENVRLFNELQEKNRALTEAHAKVSEALEQQTATSEILRVISSSPTFLQPVLDTIARNAALVCGATDGVVHLVDGGDLPVVAHYGLVGGIEAVPIRRFPLTRGSVAGRAIIEGRTVQVEDASAVDEAEFPLAKQIARQTGHRTGLATPLLREGNAIGALVIRRLEVRPFTDKQIELLKTFADQAVIAIENVRLFNELAEKNRALTDAHATISEALERQTATAEILRVTRVPH